MGKSCSKGSLPAPGQFLDVIYLSDKPEMPTEIRRLFRQKRLSYAVLPLDEYNLIRHRGDLTGTVLIDAQGMDIAQDQRLGHVLTSLERENIGIILLTQRVRRPVRSFSLVPSDTSFSMTRSVESISVEELWARIQVNLAHRKPQNSGITGKLPTSISTADTLWKSKPGKASEIAGAHMDSIKEQLRLAGLLQRDFLPSNLPNSSEVQWATSFLPAEWVSGDIYDVARIDEQHIGFYVADAVGHSMPAALLTMFIKQALTMRETTDDNYRILAPSEVVTNLNIRMAAQKLSGYQFATCCYCLLNLKTRQLTFARAGHPYPILLREGQPPEQLQTRGALLGVFEDAEFVQQSVQLQPGDRVLLYSDGAETLIGRLHDQEGFQCTPEFLDLQNAPITEIVDHLTEMATNRSIEPSEVDDVTLIGLQIPGKSP